MPSVQSNSCVREIVVESLNDLAVTEDEEQPTLELQDTMISQNGKLSTKANSIPLHNGVIKPDKRAGCEKPLVNDDTSHTSENKDQVLTDVNVGNGQPSSTMHLPNDVDKNAKNKKDGFDPGNDKSLQNEGHTTEEDNLATLVAKNPVLQFLERHHVVKKFNFVVSVVTIILLTGTILDAQWILPYYFTVSLPMLLILRIKLYWKLKWQFFLIDFCYFANTFSAIALWAAPDNPMVFCVFFAFANGPLGWAIPVFRNSVVFHSTDRMTSMYIHVIPLFTSYCIRWFPTNTSKYWYKPFVTEFDQDINFLLLWMVAVPLACVIVHSIFLIIIIHALCRPGPEYLYSYNYLIVKFDKLFTWLKLGRLGKVDGGGNLLPVWPCLLSLVWILPFLRITPRKLKPVAYYGLNWLMSFVTILSSLLFYKFFIAHSIAMCLFLFIGIYNGASFYMDKFAEKGHKAESA